MLKTSQRIIREHPTVEIARQVNKAHLLIRALDGLLPTLSPKRTEHLTSVLDIACGPGVWALELARAQPHLHVVGVDTSNAMITYARTILQKQALHNVEYLEIPDFIGPFPFKNAAFDLINIQFASKFLAIDAWQPFLLACWHLLRPGGILRLVDAALDRTNSPAHEELSRLFIQAVHQRRGGISLSHQYIRLLRELVYAVGFQECSTRTNVVNYSYGTCFHEEWKKDYLILSQELQRLIVEREVATQNYVDRLHQQQQYEMSLPIFHAVHPLFTMWATRS